HCAHHARRALAQPRDPPPTCAPGPTVRTPTLRRPGIPPIGRGSVGTVSHMGAEPLTITVLEGDETGQELLEQALRVLDPEVIGIQITLDRHDLSLERRRETSNAVVWEAAEAMRRSGLGLKAATITPEGA